MALAMKEYAKYMVDLEEENEENGPAAAAPTIVRQTVMLELEKTSDGFPIIPEMGDTECDEDSRYLMKLVRSFLTVHYRR